MNKSDSEVLRGIANNLHDFGRLVLYDDGGPESAKERREFIANLRRIADTIEALRPLTGNEQKAFDAFAEVCNEPIPEGMGKEYMNGLIKMKAFMAGRSLEYERMNERKAVSDEEIEEALLSNLQNIPERAKITRHYYKLGWMNCAKWMRDKMQLK